MRCLGVFSFFLILTHLRFLLGRGQLSLSLHYLRSLGVPPPRVEGFRRSTPPFLGRSSVSRMFYLFYFVDPFFLSFLAPSSGHGNRWDTTSSSLASPKVRERTRGRTAAAAAGAPAVSSNSGLHAPPPESSSTTGNAHRLERDGGIFSLSRPSRSAEEAPGRSGQKMSAAPTRPVSVRRDSRLRRSPRACGNSPSHSLSLVTPGSFVHDRRPQYEHIT